MKNMLSENEQLDYLINRLSAESSQLNRRRWEEIDISSLEIGEKHKLFRSLINTRPAMPIDEDFIKIQNGYLKKVNQRKSIIDYAKTDEVRKNIYLWQGDITRLKIDSIVNAANPKLLGCFIPCHGCIDNEIHTYAGLELRLECNKIMKKQGHDEPAGHAKITGAYNLPSKYIIHTVGPYVSSRLSEDDRTLLRFCYISCLKLAEEHDLTSIAFCCISTGEYRFPQEEAAMIAIDSVRKYLKENNSGLKVLFNVFKETDHQIYRRLLTENK